MSKDKLYKFSVALVVLIGLAFIMNECNKPSRHKGAKPGENLFADLDVNEIYRVEIISSGNTNTLTTKEEIWVLESLYDYPADWSKLREQINNLPELTVGQVLSDGVDYLADFGLDTNATQLILKDKEGEELSVLLIGKDRSSGGTYVCFPESEVILIEDFDLPDENEDWIDKDLLKINSTEITSVKVLSNKTSYTLNIDSNNQYLISGSLATNETLNASNAGRLARAMQYLSCEKVLDPSLPDVELGFDKPIRYEATTKNGQVYTILLGKTTEDGCAIRIDSPAEHLKGWTYLISTYNAESFSLSRDQLIDVEEAPIATAETPLETPVEAPASTPEKPTEKSSDTSAQVPEKAPVEKPAKNSDVKVPPEQKKDKK